MAVQKLTRRLTYPPALVAQVQRAVQRRPLEGFVPGEGPFPTRVMVVGEAPGRQEIETGHPFVGASGQELTKLLALAGLQRSAVYITSVVRSRPYHLRHGHDRAGRAVVKRPNRTPTKREVAAFAPLFDWEIATVAPEIVIPLGNTALQRLVGPQATIGALHGQVLKTPVLTWQDDQYSPGNKPVWVVPMYHPAAYLYARRLEATVRNDWAQLGAWLQAQYTDH